MHNARYILRKAGSVICEYVRARFFLDEITGKVAESRVAQSDGTLSTWIQLLNSLDISITSTFGFEGGMW